MRSRVCAALSLMRGGASICKTGWLTTVSVITPVAPVWIWDGLGSASPRTLTSFAPAEPASDHARKSFGPGSRFAAARHGVEF